MKRLQIYDPAMCCSTGICGSDVDPKLVQVANFLKNLDACRVKVERFNLSQEPAEYAKEPVAGILKEKGTAALPLTLVDGEVVASGEYPELGELSKLLGTSEVTFEVQDCSGCSGCN